MAAGNSQSLRVMLLRVLPLLSLRVLVLRVLPLLLSLGVMILIIIKLFFDFLSVCLFYISFFFYAFYIFV